MNQNIAYQLFRLHKEQVARVRKIDITHPVAYKDLCRVYYRATQITILDLLLVNHRAIHETAISKLPGKMAFVHKAMMKYQWPVSKVESLSLSEIFLLLQEDINYKSFDSEVSQYFTSILCGYDELYFDDAIESEWDPTLYQKIQQHF